MEVLVRVNNQSSGREKVARFIQFSCKIGWYYAQKAEFTSHYVDHFENLELTFESFRKVLRLGRCLDSLYTAYVVTLDPDLDDLVLITILALSKIFDAFFLFADHVIWCAHNDIIKANLAKWKYFSNRYRLMTIIMNLVRDAYEILQILERTKAMIRLASGEISFFIFDQPALFFDTVRNLCDLFIPMTSLELTYLSAGAIGILGCISSAIGIYTLINPELKLKFA